MIGEKIKELRRGRDLTQEKLAEYLCVSYQAVSKWETGMSNPDIELLPALANLFGVSTDELLGVSTAGKEQRLIAIIKRMCEAIERESGDPAAIDEHINILRDGLREFPDNYILLSRLAGAFWNKMWDLKNSGNLNEAREYADEAVKIYTRLLSGGVSGEYMPMLEREYGYTRESVGYGAINGLAYIYRYFLDDAKTAVEWANKLPTVYDTREQVLSRVLDGERQLVQIRQNIEEYGRLLREEQAFFEKSRAKNF